jgi:hypothetical protein
MKTMQHARFLIVLVFLLVAGGGRTVPDAGANEAGGLPALDARVQALQTTVASLQAANTTLQATVATLQAANTTLQNALNTEVAARMAGDTTLQTALTQETTQRSTAIASVQTALNTETANRMSGDLHVQDLVNNTQTEVYKGSGKIEEHNLNNNFGIVVADVDIPPGDYLFHAVVSVHNFDSDDQFGGCALEEVSPGSTITPASDIPTDWFDLQPPGVATALLSGFTFDETVEEREQLTMLTHAHVATQAEWAITCVGFGWRTLGGELVAEKVAVVH